MLASRSAFKVLYGFKMFKYIHLQIRPTEEELKEMGPEFNALWDKYFKDKPDKPVM